MGRLTLFFGGALSAEESKVTVWDSGNGMNGGNSTANFISGNDENVPPLNDLFNMAGLNLPSYLKGSDEENKTMRIFRQNTQFNPMKKALFN